MTVSDGLDRRADAVGPAAPARADLECLRATAALLAALDVAVALREWWVMGALALAMSILLPGYLVLRALRLSRADLLRSPGWLVSVGVVALMGTGLLVNLAGPVLGLDRPLSTVPLTVALNLACLGLAAAPGTGTPTRDLAAAWTALDRRGLASLVVPATAAIATLRLNSGHGSTLSILAAAAAVGLVGVGIWAAPRWSTQRQGWLLGSATLALLLGYSLRSDYVFGWDISAEYSLLERTISDASWASSHPGDAYGAMLSLTILPAFLHAVSGFSGLVLLKLVFPVLFSVMPVVTFALLRTVVPSRAAFLGASLLLTLPPFIGEMPALGRQEISLLVFVSLLAALVDTHLGGRRHLVLLLILTGGVVVSHYSTTYALVTVLGGAVVVQLLVGARRGGRRFDPRKLVVLGASVVLGLAWYQGVTNSTGHALTTVSQLLESGLRILPSDGQENALQAYLRGPNPPAPVTVPQYQTAVAADFARERPWIVPVPGAEDPRWDLSATPSPTAQQSPSAVLALASLASLVFGQLVILMAVGGTLVLLVRRRTEAALLDFAILAVPSIALLGLVRVSSTVAESYGQDRLYIQLMPIVVVPVLWSLGALWQRADVLGGRVAAGRWRTVRRPMRAILVLGLSAYAVGLVASSAGIVNVIANDRTAPNLYNGGEHFARFYVTAPEVAAARWLAAAQPDAAVTYTDEYGQLRIFGYGRPKGVILTDVTPRTLDQHSWVYATRVNSVEGQARVNYRDQQIVYEFPRAFLTDRLGIMYANGSSEVFHG